MLRLVSDENFNGDIVRALLRRHPELDLVRVQNVGLRQTPDAEILEWAASQGRVLLSHDISTVPPAAYQRVGDGKPMPGVFIVSDRMSIGLAVDEILFLSLNAVPDEWKDLVLFLPCNRFAEALYKGGSNYSVLTLAFFVPSTLQVGRSHHAGATIPKTRRGLRGGAATMAVGDTPG